jgi:hypothetical protein
MYVIFATLPINLTYAVIILLIFGLPIDMKFNIVMGNVHIDIIIL